MNSFEDDFKDLTPLLLDFGWLFGPKIPGGEFDALKRCCAQIRAVPQMDARERRTAEKQLSDLLVFHTFHPNYRAYYVWLAMTQPFMKDFSHLLERATIHYFSRDYLSTTHCLIPMIEGVLRAHHKHHNLLAGQRLHHSTLMTFLRTARPLRSYPQWHAMYREALANFLERWLWKATDQADWSLSHLNRHYALHGKGTDSYYRASDCHRLFIFLDMYMEMLVLESGIGEYPAIPGHEPALERRRRYYERIMLWTDATSIVSRAKSLMREHPHFHEDADEESLNQVLVRWAGIIGLRQ